ncbi:MAG TPA: DUF3426 domain-containing protein [Rhizomicrobium sp.]|jgi:predicted Zn finger-like uncharacterized protein|nr:DUF3426 domain-containing protein [Rhizomicrobium sp.]
MIITCPECATNYQADAAKFPAAGRKVKCAKCGHAWHQAAPAPEAPAAPVVEEPEAPPPSPPEPVVVRTPEPEPEPQEPDPEPEEAAPEPDPAPEPVEVEHPRTASAYAPAADVTHAHTPVVQPPRDTASAGPIWRRRILLGAGWLGLALLLYVIGWAAMHYRQMIATAWPQTSSLYAAVGKPVNPHGIEFEDVSYSRELQDGQQVLQISGRLVNDSGREQPVPQIRAALSDKNGRELYHWTFSAGVTTLKSDKKAKFVTRISSPPAGTKHLEVRFVRTGE